MSFSNDKVFIYMNNFRGFSKTTLELQQVNFLIGENSTGKSSFLKLLYLFSSLHFWMSFTFKFEEDQDEWSFDDIVSNSSEDKSFFEIGFTNNTKKETILLRFKKDQGIPTLEKYIEVKGKTFLAIYVENESIRYQYNSNFNFSSIDLNSPFLKIANLRFKKKPTQKPASKI